MLTISPTTHYDLYHDWQKALAFCRSLPEVAPPEPVTFHMFWRQQRPGLWRRTRRFGRKQSLPVKAFFATQDLSRCSLMLWSDEDLSSNEWLRPFAPHLAFRIYQPDVEVRGTALEQLPAVYRQQDRRVWRDGDLFRILALHNYGGVYVDMDMVLLRSVGVLLDQEFIYQWEDFDDDYNGALMHLWKGGAFARELIAGVIEIPPGDFNWGRRNLRRAVDQGHPIAVLPGAFFDTEWQTHARFKPFSRTPTSNNMYDGAFAWHWHNHWDDRIQAGSKFELIEARIHQKLAARGLSTGPTAEVVNA